MTFITPACSYCTRFNAENRLKEVCTAFPMGIPAEILNGKNNHQTPVEGDNGILFQPIKGFEYLVEDKSA